MESIIVYRNPVEAAFWESMMNGGAPIFFTVIAIAIIAVAIYGFLENVGSKARYQRRVFISHGNKESIRQMIIGKIANHSGKIAISVAIFLLYVAHHVSMSL